MDLRDAFRDAGKKDILRGGASREAWEFLDTLNACGNDKQRALFIDHAFNELVKAVVKKLTGKDLPPTKQG